MRSKTILVQRGIHFALVGTKFSGAEQASSPSRVGFPPPQCQISWSGVLPASRAGRAARSGIVSANRRRPPAERRPLHLVVARVKWIPPLVHNRLGNGRAARLWREAIRLPKIVPDFFVSHRNRTRRERIRCGPRFLVWFSRYGRDAATNRLRHRFEQKICSAQSRLSRTVAVQASTRMLHTGHLTHSWDCVSRSRRRPSSSHRMRSATASIRGSWVTIRTARASSRAIS